jgi:UDP-N-acetylmuramoyl-tripeptide--D-alanyl-D-alanine ligase
LKGRGARHRIAVRGGKALLIDESYNANPASMAATLKSLGEEKIEGRRFAVLGPMRELGQETEKEHAALAEPAIAAGVDHLILIGPEMDAAVSALGGRIASTRVDDVDGATGVLKALIGPGDAILVKASNSVGLAKLVDALTGDAD